MVDYFAIESYQVEKYGKDRRILANWTTRRVAPRRTLWVALGKKIKMNKARVLFCVSHHVLFARSTGCIHPKKK